MLPRLWTATGKCRDLLSKEGKAMNLYLSEKKEISSKAVVLDDTILTTEFPTTAGSKMLEGYKSLFDAEVVEKLKNSGFEISGKANVGELSLGLLGETSYFGAVTDENGALSLASSEILKKGDAVAAVGLDANGSVLRSAAVSGQVCVKPTYGTVSRFGTVSVACSGETVCVSALTVDGAQSVLNSIVGHDEKDGTSLSEEKCALVKSGAEFKSVKKVALAASLVNSCDASVKTKLDAVVASLEKNGVCVETVDDSLLLSAKTAWNILMSAELCNNVSKYDGIKYGYRSKNYTNIDELYTNSRTEAFGEILKTTILFGSEALSTENYMPVYDKSLRIRRLICEKFAEIFESFGAVIMPVCSKTSYSESDVKENKYISFDEALYIAPAFISGLPSVVVGGAQIVGPAFSENALFELARIIEKEGN